MKIMTMRDQPDVPASGPPPALPAGELGQQIVITGVRMSFRDMVDLALKWFFACVVAGLLVGAMMSVAWVIGIMFLYAIAQRSGF